MPRPYEKTMISLGLISIVVVFSLRSAETETRVVFSPARTNK